METINTLHDLADYINAAEDYQSNEIEKIIEKNGWTVLKGEDIARDEKNNLLYFNERGEAQVSYDSSRYTIKVDKNDYYIKTSCDGEYYGILKKSNDDIVWGYDSANTDNYDKDLVESVYEQWDGTLTDVNRNGEYSIEGI